MSTNEEFVDLTREPVYDSAGRRITECDAEDAAKAIEREDVKVDETRMSYPRRDRPSPGL